MPSEKYPLDLNAVLRGWQNGNPRIVQIHCLEDFIRLSTWLHTSDHVIFRGQKCDWPLVPTAGRFDERNNWFSNEEAAFGEFKREALPYLRFIPSNDWQWLAVAQHNRLPTRLLDWTKNPLAALWFAVCEPALSGQPGVVWAHSYYFSEVISNTVNRKDSPFSIDRTYVYFPEHVFPYIQAQSGVFTVHYRKPDDKRFVPFQESKGADNLLTKIEITPDSFWVIRHQLFRLGVHPASLFPGLSGLVDRIKHQNELLADDLT